MTTSEAVPAEGLAARLIPAGVTSAGAPVRIGTVGLTVRDLETVSRF